jgi:hypothetical protein
VAFHLAAAAATSAGKELHAAVAVLVEVEVKQPAVEVVAGCLEALVDPRPRPRPERGGLRRRRRSVALRCLAPQIIADVVLCDGDAGTEAAVKGGAAAAGAGGFPVHDDQVCAGPQVCAAPGLPGCRERCTYLTRCAVRCAVRRPPPRRAA